jgi:hypothetical protein
LCTSLVDAQKLQSCRIEIDSVRVGGPKAMRNCLQVFRADLDAKKARTLLMWDRRIRIGQLDPLHPLP